MSTKKKQVIAFRIESENQNGYQHTHIRIETRNEIKVCERIFQSCKDPSYYGGPERWQPLAVLGHDVYYESTGQASVYVSYLHGSSGGYCAHQIREITDGLKGLTWATKLLTKLSREIAKKRDEYYGPKDNYSFLLNSPESLLDALRSLGAIEIEYTASAYPYTGEAVARFSPPHLLLDVAA